MLRPKQEKREKIKLTKADIQRAKGIFSYLKPYRVTFGIGWVFLLLSTSAGLVFPYLLGQLLGSSGSPMTPGSNAAESMLPINSVTEIAVALFVLFAVQSIFSFFRILLFTNVTENVLQDLRQTAFSKLIYMPMDFFNAQKVGELTSRISSDLGQIQETLRTTIAEFFRQIVIVLGGIAFLAYTSWKLSLIMLATVPVMAIFAVIFGRFIKRLSKEAQDITAQSNVIVEESLMGIANVKAFTNEVLMLANYKKQIQAIRDLNVKSGLWRGLFVSFILFFLFGAIVFIIWQGLLLTQGANPELSSKDLNSFLIYTVMMGASIGSLPELYASMQKSVGATENLMKIIQMNDEHMLLPGTKKPTIHGEIEFSDVHFHYPQRADVEILKGIRLQAKSNQTIALVGSSGAGKSTIASLLLRFYDVQQGEIRIDGTPISEMDVAHLRANMAIVPQEVILFGGTIYENILYGSPTASREQVVEAARQANALSFIESFPSGFETQVGDRGIQLSGGQKQRIAIARALLKNPTILILDEATSALDSESEKLVQEALEYLMRGRTSLVIAHRLSTIRKADMIFVLQDGQVVEAGKHEELIEQPSGVYANLVALQQ